MDNKVERWALKRENLYWGGTHGWVDDVNRSLYYFSAENAQNKGPKDGKVVRVIVTTTIREAK